MASYSVNVWGCKPGTDDKCWTGDDYETRAAAKAAFEDPWGVGGFNPTFCGLYQGDEVWIEIDGVDIHEERCLQRQSNRHRADDLWEREIATQAGFAFGCDGYNDAYGY